MRWPALALTLSVLVACSGSEPAEAPAAAPEAPAAPEASAKPAVVVPPTSGLVSITAAGVELDPPAEKDQIPDGAWYCDMGTVHYAATEKHDGKCPLCKMDLVHKGG